MRIGIIKDIASKVFFGYIIINEYLEKMQYITQ